MILRALTLRREGDYGYGSVDRSKPFRATVELIDTVGSEIKLLLPPTVSERVLAIIANEVAEAGAATARAMTADVFTAEAVPQLEAPLVD